MSVLEGKSIAILGGTGTVGRAIVRFIARSKLVVDQIIIFSRDEIKQLEMMEEFPEEGSSLKISYYLGDIRDSQRLEEVLNGVDIVVHAAAIKHVVMAEKNPQECHKTNIIGTQNVIDVCRKNKVEQCLLISTDKAISPIGVYGKSKLEAERLFKESNSVSTTFKIIRLGNIIGSRGSVFEVFERQKTTGVIKVTHPDATRFYISQEDAAGQILQMFEPDSPLEFIPEMETFNVLELAKQIAPECQIEFIGLRPGDKLHEEVGEVRTNWLVRDH